MTLYDFLKWIHILLTVAALGANITYFIWIRRAVGMPEALPFTLRGVRLIDRRIVNPAYGLLLITGVGMLWVGRLPLSTPWIELSLGLYAVTFLLALFGYSPALRRQIELVESEGAVSESFRATERRATRIGVLIILLVIAIVFLMTIKPALWA